MKFIFTIDRCGRKETLRSVLLLYESYSIYLPIFGQAYSILHKILFPNIHL